MRRYLLGIDIGTSGAKTLLVEGNGNVVAEAITEYPMRTPRPLWAEQEPEDWWSATVTSINKVLSDGNARPEQVAAVGLTGQMHGLVLLDNAGQPLRPCIMWNDQRSGPQCTNITKKVGLARILKMTGNPLLPGFTGPKVAWVSENEPGIIKKTTKVLLPKDYVRYRLTGAFRSDVSDASGTAFFDVENRKWSAPMLKILKMPKEWLPQVTESPEVSASISADVAKDTGLRAHTPVVAGAGDQAAQAVGTGIVDDGLTCVTIGTSGVVFTASRNYIPDKAGRLHVFCHAVPGMWHMMGVMLSAGGSLRWFRDNLGEREVEIAKGKGVDPYEVLTGQASQVPPGSDGLIFLPYLSGERTPHPDPKARGAFIGLTVRHTKPHMTRAVMEGVTFGLRDSLGLIEDLQLKVGEVRASGGGARSALWRQMIADIFEKDVSVVNVTQGAAFGAAILAGVGVGIYDSVQAACRKMIRVVDHARPGKAALLYKKLYGVFRKLYPRLKEDFEGITDLALGTGD